MFLLFINVPHCHRMFCTMYRLWCMSSHTSSVFMLCLMGIVDVVLKGVEFSFVETDYTVDEGEGVQHVCVEVTGALETSIRVTVDTQPYTALGMVWYFMLHVRRFSSMLMIIKTPTSLCKIDNNSVHVHYWTHEVIRCITKHWSNLLTLLAHCNIALIHINYIISL